jgi:hypothetical protein
LGFRRVGANDNNPLGGGANNNESGINQRARERIDALNKEGEARLIREANDNVDEQNRLLETRYSLLGKSTAEIAKAEERQRLHNQAVREGGEAYASLMAPAIEKVAERVGEVTKKQEDYNKLISFFDEARGAARDFANTFVQGLARGEKGIDALKSALQGLSSKLISKGIDMLIESVLGRSGSGGGLLASLFGGGGGGGSAGGLSSLFSSAFSSGGGAFALGGIMSSRGPIPLNRYEGGGIANSPQIALFGEGKGPEAYVPLPDGRSIPVSMRGSAPYQKPANNNVNITGGSVVVQGSIKDDNLAQVQSMIAAANRETQRQIQRNFGPMGVTYNKRAG